MSYEIRLAELVSAEANEANSETFSELANTIRQVLTFLSTPGILKLQELRCAAADAKEARRAAERGYDDELLAQTRTAHEAAVDNLFNHYEREVAPLLLTNEVGGLPHSLPTYIQERELLDKTFADLIQEWELLDKEEKREVPLMPPWWHEDRAAAWARHEARAGRKSEISAAIRQGEREARSLIRIGEYAVRVASLYSPMGDYHWDIRWRAGDDGNSSICPWG